MIDREHALSVSRQAKMVGIARSTVYSLPRPVPASDLALMTQIDRLHTEFPFAGSRMLRRLLAINGSKVGRRHVKTLMQRIGIGSLPQAAHDDTRARPHDLSVSAA
jgi:putative transposase